MFPYIIYECIYICRCTRTCTCFCICICICRCYAHAHMYMYMYMYICTYVAVIGNVTMYLVCLSTPCLTIYICVLIHMYIHIYTLHTCSYICMGTYLYIQTYASSCIHVCMDTDTYINVCVCVCISISVFTHTDMCASQPGWPRLTPQSTEVHTKPGGCFYKWSVLFLGVLTTRTLFGAYTGAPDS